MNRLKLILVMIIWGSLGVFTRSIPLSALSLAFLRAFIALPVLFLVVKYGKLERPSLRSALPYLFSGVLLGFGWLTLFYGFKLTSVSSAVMIYNMCPVYVLILAPIVLKESITRTQTVVILLSFLGLFLVVNQGATEGMNPVGLVLSAISGMIYATIVLLNRKLTQGKRAGKPSGPPEPAERPCATQGSTVDNRMATFLQILSAMLVLLPFVLLEGDIKQVMHMDAMAILLTILLGIVHTGLAYTLFFSLYARMKSVEIVSYSFLEPLFGILFSFIFLAERLSPLQVTGGLLILGSNYFGEKIEREKGKRERLERERMERERISSLDAGL